MLGSAVGRWLELFRGLFVREIRSRFIGSATGWLWLVFNPLLLLAVYAFVFGVIFRARLPESLDIPFIAWLAIALWPWLAFADAILKGSQAIVGNAALISKVAMPRELLVLPSSAAVFGLHIVGYLVVLVVVDLLAADIYWSSLPAILLVLIPLFIIAMAFALFFGALQVYVRDVEHLLPTVMMMWFFLTPILYAPIMLPEAMQGWFVWNPMYWVMERIREITLFGLWMPGLVDLLLWLGAIGALVMAALFFARVSPYFDDYL